MYKPTVYTAFANSETNPLPQLSKEALTIADTYQPLAFNDKIYYLKDEMCDVDRLTKNFVNYGPRFDIFYFSGHASDGCLELAENFIAPQTEVSNLIVASLTNARLIFLNACETFGLAKQIITERQSTKHDLVMIACPNKINASHGELFATLLLQQIGQPDNIYAAYNRVKSVVNVLFKGNVRFKEFTNKEDVLAADKDFDIGYIEIRGSSGDEEAAASEPKPEKATSMIGNDPVLLDVLTTNYLTTIVESLSKEKNSELSKQQVQLLREALETAQKMASGKRNTKQTKDLFEQAAQALPGIDSGTTFSSLVNTEKKIANPKVQKFIMSKEFGINQLVKAANEIKVAG